MNDTLMTQLQNLFLALSDKTRIKLLSLMAAGEVSVGFLADELGESQPKISRHLAYLRAAGIVSTRRDGKWVYYGIERQADPSVTAVLNSAIAAVLGNAVVANCNLAEESDRPGQAPYSNYSRESEFNELPVYLL